MGDNSHPSSLEDLFEKTYAIAVESGIPANEYWDYTYAEIIVSIDAYTNRERRRQKEQAALTHQLADLIGISVSRLFGDGNFPTLFERFPHLFEDELEEERASKFRQQDWKIAKDRLMQYAQVHNHKINK